MVRYGETGLMQTYLGAAYGDTDLVWNFALPIDLDADGVDEVLVTSSDRAAVFGTRATGQLLFGYRDGQLVDLTLEYFLDEPLIVLAFFPHVADFNADGIDDIYLPVTGTEDVRPFPGEQNRLFLSDPDGRYRDSSSGLPQITDFSHGAVPADFDGDGDIDIFQNTLGDDEFYASYLLLNDGQGSFSGPFFVDDPLDAAFDETFDFRQGPNFPALIDVGADGIPDIYLPEISRFDEGEFIIDGFGYAENDGSARFTAIVDDTFRYPQPVLDAIAANEAADWGDIDGDGDLDLLSIMQVPDGPDPFLYLQLFRNDGAAGYVDISNRLEGQETGIAFPTVLGLDAQLVDFEMDGDLDIAFQRNGSETGLVNLFYRNDGENNFSLIPLSEQPSGWDPKSAPEGGTGLGGFFVFADINGDWLPDVVHTTRTGIPEAIAQSEGEVLDFAAYQLAALSDPVDYTGGVGANRLAGGSADDILRGMAGDDSLNGNGGDDLFDSGAGADLLFGGDGRDTAFYATQRANLSFADGDGGSVVVEDGNGTPDTLFDVERIALEDGVWALDIGGAAVGQVYRLYDAAFARTPDEAGFRYWMGVVNDGLAPEALPTFFIDSLEFELRYGDADTTEDFVARLYQNALRREPEPDGFDYWVGVIGSGAVTQEAALWFFSESVENVMRNEANLDGGVWLV